MLALPGHTPGHLGLWDSANGVAIVIDAVLSDGVYDRAGNRLIPPRYYDAGAYEATIRQLRALDPELLLTAHYEVMDRAAAREFLDGSLDFVRSVRAAVRSAGTVELRALTDAVNAAVGPFPAFTHELAASARAFGRDLGGSGRDDELEHVAAARVELGEGRRHVVEREAAGQLLAGRQRSGGEHLHGRGEVRACTSAPRSAHARRAAAPRRPPAARAA